MVGDSLSELEQRCGWQAEAGVNWLLKQHEGIPQTRVSRSGRLRRRIVRSRDLLVLPGDTPLLRGFGAVVDAVFPDSVTAQGAGRRAARRRWRRAPTG